ncbi:MAG: ABC transporter substrate-binding protein [Desulfobacterales bacterium]|nr:ABC transporter substrate-binding protein [Desulfobacterales bacterium]
MRKNITCGLLLIIFILQSFLVTHQASAESELRVGWLQTEVLQSMSCNDAWQYETMGCILWQLLYDQPWVMDSPPDYKFKPMAITGYETTDHKNFVFHVRKGMTFHDGKPVTANDVAFTMEYLPISNPVWAYYDSKTVKDSIVIVDDYTIKFEMKNTISPQYAPFNWFPVFPMHIWKRHKFDMEKFENKKAIGSGPFTLEDFKAGQYATFRKFDDYWENKPRVDKITFKSYGTNDSRVMALKKGEIDMMGYGGVGPLSAKILRKAEDIEVIETPGISINYITFNLHPQGLLQDVEARKAIAHGLDKAHMLKMIYHGYATEHDSFIYPENNEYNPKLPKFEYNPELANKLLDKTGYIDTDGDGIRNKPDKGDNLVLKFIVSTDTAEAVKFASLFREQMKKLGLQIKIIAMDLDTFYDILYYPQGNAFDIAYADDEPGPIANWIWEYLRSWDDEQSSGWNTSFYNNPDFDRLLDAYNSEVNIEKKKMFCFEMQEIMARDIPYYILSRETTLSPVRVDKLEGYVGNYMGGTSCWMNPFSFFYVHPKEK